MYLTLRQSLTAFVAQAALPASAFQGAGITGMHHHSGACYIIFGS